MTPSIDRSRSTTIYFLLSIIIALSGVVLAGWGAVTGDDGQPKSPTVVSIGTSLLAGGLASIGFGVLRALDDRDQVAHQSVLDDGWGHLVARIDRVRDEVSEARDQMAKSTLLTTSAAQRCVSDVEIGERFRTEYTRAGHAGEPVQVDVLGLKLLRFLSDQLDWIESVGVQTRLRLLVQHPGNEIFEEICALEARSVSSTRRDLARTVKMLTPSEVVGNSLLWSSGTVDVELRLFDRYQPVTLFRVGQVAYVRPRVSTPRGAASRFYEVYDEGDSRNHFAVHHAHFQTCWEDSNYVVPDSIATLIADA